MLSDSEVSAMVPVKDIKAAEEFYSGTLGLKKVDENMAGITYQCGQSKMFIYPTPMAGTAKSTVATWNVEDIKKVTDELGQKGIDFEHYEYPGAEHDGPIHIMAGMKAAWFKDVDGNILGLAEV